MIGVIDEIKVELLNVLGVSGEVDEEIKGFVGVIVVVSNEIIV